MPATPKSNTVPHMLDFIERYFGMSPDGGNGSAEFLLVWAMIILLIVVSALLLAPRAS